MRVQCTKADLKGVQVRRCRGGLVGPLLTLASLQESLQQLRSERAFQDSEAADLEGARARARVSA